MKVSGCVSLIGLNTLSDDELAQPRDGEAYANEFVYIADVLSRPDFKLMLDEDISHFGGANPRIVTPCFLHGATVCNDHLVPPGEWPHPACMAKSNRGDARCRPGDRAKLG